MSNVHAGSVAFRRGAQGTKKMGASSMRLTLFIKGCVLTKIITKKSLGFDA